MTMISLITVNYFLARVTPYENTCTGHFFPDAQPRFAEIRYSVCFPRGAFRVLPFYWNRKINGVCPLFSLYGCHVVYTLSLEKYMSSCYTTRFRAFPTLNFSQSEKKTIMYCNMDRESDWEKVREEEKMMTCVCIYSFVWKYNRDFNCKHQSKKRKKPLTLLSILFKSAVATPTL